MKLAPVGKVDNPEQVNFEPITIPICGLAPAKQENVCEEFDFKPTRPWGQIFAMFEADDDRAFAGGVVRWLYTCLVDDEERDRFRAFLQRDDVEIEQATIESVFQVLSEEYAARPTLPQSSSTGTGGSTKRTSRAASRSRASKSRTSPQRSRST